MRLLIFGFGYSASAAAARMKDHDAVIWATTRDPQKTSRMSAQGMAPFLFDGRTRTPELTEAIEKATHLLVSIPPSEEGGDPVLALYGETMGQSNIEAIVYLSTIGVYGDAGGACVDEETLCRPHAPRLQARLRAETGWQALESANRSVAILRLSGIYGPGRNALVNLARGTARRLVKPGQVFNRIHVEDIAAGVERAFALNARGLFNITDDEPAPPQDVVAFAAHLMGIAPPAEEDFAAARLSPMAREFYGSNKRVRNRRSKEMLGLAYRYPHYRAGLTALWQSGKWREGGEA